MSARREEAVVVEEEQRTKIFVGNLQIEVNKDPQEDGPLGMKEYGGREPGVVFWRHKGIVKNWDEGSFEHSVGEHIGHANLSKITVDSILDEVNRE